MQEPVAAILRVQENAKQGYRGTDKRERVNGEVL